ncbi:MAG: hypothetical protein ACYDGY_05020, partial [Acidimicrobiales bacterium]
DGTWTWNGATWTQQHPAKSPPALFGGSMAYDSATRQVVLFGGSSSDQLLNATWAWNGATWIDRSARTAIPPARLNASMAYDSATRQVVLFGGAVSNSSSSSDTGLLNDTWTWNGSGWTEQYPGTGTSANRSTSAPTLLPPTSSQPVAYPSVRDSAPMAYDSATRQVVLFGGYDYVSYISSTWGYIPPSGNQGLTAGPGKTSHSGGLSSTSLLAAIVLSGLAIACIVYIVITWSTHRRQHPNPQPG